MPKIQVNSISMNYAIYGDGDPVLFLHGLGSSLLDWEFQIEPFAKEFKVVLCDLRGHGQTDKPAGRYNVPLFASDAADLIQALKLGPVHVVGISMGGMVAYQLALDFPALVKSLTIVNSQPELKPRNPNEHLQLLRRRILVHVFGLGAVARFLAGRLFPKPEQAIYRRIFIERWLKNDLQAYRKSFEGLVGWSVTERLPALEKPVQLISGDRDYFDYAQPGFAALIPNASLVRVPDSGHATPVDQPEFFNHTVLSFLHRVNQDER